MAGLDPAIQASLQAKRNCVDARIKSAHDESGCFSALILVTSFSVRL
jgi:hypothetical protein